MAEKSRRIPQPLLPRTKQFALRIIKLCEALPSRRTADVIAKQLLRSGTSVGANYHEACRSRSNAEFVSKLGICLQELSESEYWLELLIESETISRPRLQPLLEETLELTAIFVRSIKTARK